MNTELAADYYHANFYQLVTFVRNKYQLLLSTAENVFFDDFAAAPRNSQMLYVRLLSRKGSHFRASKLRYGEIDNLQQAARDLQKANLLGIDDPIGYEEILRLFTKTEILKTLSLSVRPNAKKEEVVQSALAVLEDPGLTNPLKKFGKIYTVYGRQHFDTYRLIFLGNMHTDLTAFVLRDLGIRNFENYQIDPNNLPFRSRKQIDAHLMYYDCMKQLEQLDGIDVQSLIRLQAQLPSCYFDDEKLEKRIERCRIKVARQLERLGELSAAVAIYQNCKLPPSRERQARIYVKLKSLKQAEEILIQIKRSPRTEQELQFATDFGHRVLKKKSWPKANKYVPPEQTVFLKKTDLSVELAVVEYFQKDFPVFYVENSLFCSLFGLFFWDIIFAPVAGVFFNPFQMAPSDFYDPGFITKRADLIENRICELSNPAVLRQRIVHTFIQKKGTVNPMVHWENITLALLEQSLYHIPAKDLKLIFGRILMDRKNNQSGFPDLIVFDNKQGYALLEVKAQGDRLQKNQALWMAFFAENKIAHQVVNVKWIANND